MAPTNDPIKLSTDGELDHKTPRKICVAGSRCVSDEGAEVPTSGVIGAMNKVGSAVVALPRLDGKEGDERRRWSRGLSEFFFDRTGLDLVA